VADDFDEVDQSKKTASKDKLQDDSEMHAPAVADDLETVDELKNTASKDKLQEEEEIHDTHPVVDDFEKVDQLASNDTLQEKEEAHASPVADDLEKVDQSNRSHGERELEPSAQEDKLEDKIPGPGVGTMAALDHVGFQDVLKANDAFQMAQFVRRCVRQEGLLVANEPGLAFFAERCISSEGPRQFETLSMEIFAAAGLDDSWVIVFKAGEEELKHSDFLVNFGPVLKPQQGKGLTAPLDTEGYETVSRLQNFAEMNVFIHRVINHLGLVVIDRWGLLGIVPWYDGERSTQSFSTLTQEILSIAMTSGTWVQTATTDANALTER